MPAGLVVLRSLEVSFTDASTGSPVTLLPQDVTLELPFGGLGLTAAQINHLAIYNASERTFVLTSVDLVGQVATVRTRRFGIFALAHIAAPVPMAFIPVIQIGAPSW